MLLLAVVLGEELGEEVDVGAGATHSSPGYGYGQCFPGVQVVSAFAPPAVADVTLVASVAAKARGVRGMPLGRRKVGVLDVGEVEELLEQML